MAGAHTSESDSSEGQRRVGLVGARDRDQGAVGKRDPDRLALAAVAGFGNLPVLTPRCDAVQARGQVPSLKANGAMTNSPGASVRTS